MNYLIIYATFLTLAASEDIYSQQWRDFKEKFNRTFNEKLQARSTTEETFRRIVFIANLQKILEHNKRYDHGLETYRMGVNQFVDWTKEEIDASHPLMHAETFERVPRKIVSKKAPETLTWETSHIPIKDQGYCGSCTAFAAVGIVETHYTLFRNATLALSEQEILDCGGQPTICTAGWTRAAALNYIKENGIGYESDKPYQGKVNECNKTPRSEVNVLTIDGTELGEDALKEALHAHGPLTVGMRVDDNFSWYSNGVYDSSRCYYDNAGTNHAMVLVGYGRENGIDYWLFRNSWGVYWGERGFMRLRRGKQTCNVGKVTSQYINIA